MTAAIAQLWTGHQSLFKSPIKLLQSSGWRQTSLRREHNNSFDSSTSQITSETLSTEPGRSRANGTARTMGIFHQLPSSVSSLSHSWREQVYYYYYYLGAAVICFLINTGGEYEDALGVVVTPAGFAHFPALQQLRAHQAGMCQSKGKGFLHRERSRISEILHLSGLSFCC